MNLNILAPTEIRDRLNYLSNNLWYNKEDNISDEEVHNMAEQLRNQFGYSGGSDGSAYVITSNSNVNEKTPVIDAVSNVVTGNGTLDVNSTFTIVGGFALIIFIMKIFGK